MAEKDVIVEHDIVVVWGSTGSGKSSLANRLLGLNFDIKGEPINNTEECFVVSASTESVTRDTIMKSGMWFGETTYGQVTVIDTPGLGDSLGPGQDSINISKMIKFLKSVKPGISMFLLVFLGTNARFDNNIQELVKLFDKMFSSEIWKNVALCFTNWCQDKRSRNVRATSHKAPPGKPEEREEWVQQKVGSEFNEHIGKYLGIDNFPKLPCIFLDSVPDGDDDQLIRAETEKSLRLLNRVVGSHNPFSCADAVLVKRKTEELSDEIKIQLQKNSQLEEELKKENNAKAIFAQNLIELAKQKDEVVEEIKKQVNDKEVLMEQWKKALEENNDVEQKRRVSEIKDKIMQIQQAKSQNDQLLAIIKEKEQKERVSAENHNGKVAALEKQMQYITNQLNQYKEKEKKENEIAAMKRALEKSDCINFKSNFYADQYKNHTVTAHLHIMNKTATELSNIVYRVVHIANSQFDKALAAIVTVGIYLLNASENASSPEVYQKYAHYFAFQEFHISKLQSQEEFHCNQLLQFIPYEKNFGNLYHFVSATYRNSHKATNVNWLVNLYECDFESNVRITLYDTQVNISAPSGNAYDKLMYI